MVFILTIHLEPNLDFSSTINSQTCSEAYYERKHKDQQGVKG